MTDAVAGQTVQSAASALQTSSTNALTSDFDTFLQLLTAQIQNQDPLEPADSTEFVAQLATFSSVEQQIQTNTLLESLIRETSSQSISDLASWVGMEVESTGPVSFQNTPLTLAPKLALGADRAELVAVDMSGKEVARLPVSLSDDVYAWDGRDENGLLLDAGTYQFRVENYVGDASLSSTPVSAYARVEEVRVSDGVGTLILEGGVDLAVADVTRIRP